MELKKTLGSNALLKLAAYVQNVLITLISLKKILRPMGPCTPFKSE
jgi:hypothetical protein